jgi:S-adenosylmethionine-diacylglycerol 3-amino-3-carboxypropyl transferase
MTSTLLRLGDYHAGPEQRQWLTQGAILYSTCDEDSWSELNALDLRSEDVVLSVTGSGCRTLNLLIGGPAKIVSIDANPLQNHLLELKIAAIRELPHAEFAGFIGLTASTGRLAVYRRIREALSDTARAFWDMNTHVIARGVLYSGAHERFYARYIGPLVRALRPRKTRTLFSFDSIEEQLAFFDEKWDTPRWRASLRLLVQPRLTKLLLPDPSYYLYLERTGSVADYLNSCLRQALSRHLAADNHLLTLLMLGKYQHGEVVPPYLSPRHYETVRARLDAVEIRTGGLDQELAATPAGTYSKFSLSDIAGWTTPDEFTAILGEVARTAKPDGRLCYRNFLSDRRLPPALLDSVVVRDDISERIGRSDMAIAFTFVVADVK